MGMKGLIVLAALLGSGMDFNFGQGRRSRRKAPRAKMPLSSEEEETLAALTGKNKKEFVKAMTEKYKDVGAQDDEE